MPVRTVGDFLDILENDGFAEAVYQWNDEFNQWASGANDGSTHDGLSDVLAAACIAYYIGEMISDDGMIDPENYLEGDVDEESEMGVSIPPAVANGWTKLTQALEDSEWIDAAESVGQKFDTPADGDDLVAGMFDFDSWGERMVENLMGLNGTEEDEAEGLSNEEANEEVEGMMIEMGTPALAYVKKVKPLLNGMADALRAEGY